MESHSGWQSRCHFCSSEVHRLDPGEGGTPCGTHANPIVVPEEKSAPTEQQTPPQDAKRARRDSTPSVSQTSGFHPSPNHAAFRELLEAEESKVGDEMRQVQERENSARAEREEVEKAEREERRRLEEIDEQLAALKREAEAVNRRVGQLDSARQAAAVEEERCRERRQELEESRARVAADLKAAREAETAQNELERVSHELDQRRRVLEEKELAARAAWQRAEKLEQEQWLREEQLREQAEWEEKCQREAAEARERQEAEAEADRERRAQAEADQAEMSDEPCTARQKSLKIGLLQSRLMSLIRKVGSTKAIDHLQKNKLKKAYLQAAMDTHTDKGCKDVEAIKELNSVKSDLERLGGW